MKIISILILLIVSISCSQKYTGEVHLKNCKVNHPLHDEEKERKINYEAIPNQWEYESALRKLALCVINIFKKR
ncbi:hypothetical protein [Chryseobacterium sp. G0201]|uniref:hypothetical protein n=1 Tax=Chryseobacterium sp. G0201 TaxID=2487065 RepID=UPI000F4DB67B|nr:hypothetical protein [Chryseobacterium sp. G0201]AZA55253.1 hypothetical protein EG348_20785 [Chryseobacterium sp. G0201]